MGKTDVIPAPPPPAVAKVPEGTALIEWYFERG